MYTENNHDIEVKNTIKENMDKFTKDFKFCLEYYIIDNHCNPVAESLRMFLLNGTLWDEGHRNYNQFQEDLKKLKEIVKDEEAIKYINGFLNRDIMVLNNI